eukprot:297841-Rhodomonas_salina.6
MELPRGWREHSGTDPLSAYGPATRCPEGGGEWVQVELLYSFVQVRPTVRPFVLHYVFEAMAQHTLWYYAYAPIKCVQLELLYSSVPPALWRYAYSSMVLRI